MPRKQKLGEKQYIFLDESGKPEYFGKGDKNLVELGFTSKFLVIAAVVTEDERGLQKQISESKLQALKDKKVSKAIDIDHSIDTYHASEDLEPVREFFLERIAQMEDFKALVLLADKEKAYESFKRNPERFYNSMVGELLKRILHTHKESSIVLSRKDSKLKVQKNINIEIDSLRLEYAQEQGMELKTTLHFHHRPHFSHGGLQVADYIAWAIFQYFEKGEKRYYKIIKEKVSFIHDIFNKKIYTRENPLN